MEENNNFPENISLSIIDEKPELTTLVAATEMQNSSQSFLSNKILSKLSKGYTLCTVLKVISYSLNETSFILPYCLRKLGIIPFIIFLVFLSLSSLYIFYLLIDLLVKFNIFQDCHPKIQEKTNKVLNIIYYIVNIIYHILVLIFQNYFYLSLLLRILSFFDIKMDNEFHEKIIILSLSLIILEFPLSFIKYFQRPDLLYIIFTSLIIVLNIIALVFVITIKSIKEVELIKVNLFESLSNNYFTCFSIIMTVIGWQNQISKKLEDFKIKTTKRFYKVIYLFFIIQIFLILFICFSSAPLISDSTDVIIFLLDYKNLNIGHILIIQIMSIIFGILIHIIISHHMHLIQENMLLILGLTVYKNSSNDFKINKYFLISFNLIILLISNIISLLINDISLIIILCGGIFLPIINFLFPTILYYLLVSKNSLISLFGWVISLSIIILGVISFISKFF